MKYEKPEIVNLVPAGSLIQGMKGTLGVFDGHPKPNQYTIPAYQADE